MKKLIGTGLMLFCLCFGTARIFGQGYDIKITVDGMEDSVAYLGYVFGDQRFLTDTARASSPGVYQFTGKNTLPTGIYFLYSPNYFLELIVKEQTFSLKTTKEGAFKTLEVTNSAENEVFKEFQIGMVDLETGGPSVNLIREVKKAQQEIKNLSKQHLAQLGN